MPADRGGNTQVAGPEFVDLLRGWLDANPEISPSRLAVDAGLDPSTVRKLLIGENRNPRLDVAEKICGALGVGLGEFLVANGDADLLALLRAASQLNDEDRGALLRVANALAKATEQGPSGAPADERES